MDNFYSGQSLVKLRESIHIFGELLDLEFPCSSRFFSTLCGTVPTCDRKSHTCSDLKDTPSLLCVDLEAVAVYLCIQLIKFLDVSRLKAEGPCIIGNSRAKHVLSN